MPKNIRRWGAIKLSLLSTLSNISSNSIHYSPLSVSHPINPNINLREKYMLSISNQAFILSTLAAFLSIIRYKALLRDSDAACKPARSSLSRLSTYHRVMWTPNVFKAYLSLYTRVVVTSITTSVVSRPIIYFYLTIRLVLLSIKTFCSRFTIRLAIHMLHCHIKSFCNVWLSPILRMCLGVQL